jgi:nucleoside phosphorylase
MPGEACVGRVGGLAVVLGLLAAIVTGWHSGPAWADDSASSTGPAASSNQSASENPGSTKPETDPPGTKIASTKKAEPTEKTKPGRKHQRKPHRAVVKTTRAKAAAEADVTRDATPPTAQKDTATAPPKRAEVTPRTVAPTPSAVPATAPKPVQPNVITVATKLVSSVVKAIMSPFGANRTPAGPETPSIWGLLAFARREFERAFTSPSTRQTPAEGQTTSQTEPEQRTLILSAFPAEADAILARTTLDPNPSVVVDGHHFYLGTLGGKKVVVAMTGIGMVNATNTTETALDHFTPESGITIDAVVFSGVAGGSGRTEIGDVAVPARWTSDDGSTWHPVDQDMLAAANDLTVDLLSRDTIGDPTCFCSLFAGPKIDLRREPHLYVGGDGSSDDNNNGTAFPNLPSIPFVGDMFGAQPCAAPDFSLLFTGNLFQAALPFLASGLLSNLTGLLNSEAPAVDAVDQETAAAQAVADAHGVPFLGIRGMSDGPGDPLHLPGYPFTFVVYKQIAADNAAIVTEAFLENWDGA